MSLSSIILPIERNGYIIDGGADYIERNAMNHISFLKTINNVLAANGSNEKLVIVGPSMGGQISRYALAYMEKKYEETGDDEWNHNCRLWISSDSPHLGANIPMGLQTFLNLAAPFNSSAEEFVEDWLGSSAAKQLLIEQYNGYNNNQLNVDYFDGRTTLQGFSENRGHPFFIRYFNNLYSNGLTGSRGYPQNTRKVAFINGSLTGGRAYKNVLNGYSSSFANQGERTFKVIAYQWYWAFPIPIPIAAIETYNMPAYNNNSIIARFWKIFSSDRKIYATNINSRGNMDVVPGGWFPGIDRIAKGFGGDPITSDEYGCFTSFLSDFFGGAWYEIYENKHVNPFIPAVSSLGLNDPDTNWTTPLGNRNLVCTGEIPFDNYFAPNINEGHDQFTQTSVDWLLEELSDDNVYPDPPIPLADENEIVITGDNIICYDETKTYEISNLCGEDVTWTTSSNLQIISSNNHQIKVKSTNSYGGAWIKATYGDGQTKIKNMVGKPYVTYETEGEGSYIKISIISQGLELEQQGITNTIWQKTGGTGDLLASNGDLSAWGNGSDYEGWYVDGNVKVYNSCGYSIIGFHVVSAGDDTPCDDPNIEQNIIIIPEGENLYKVVDPCFMENTVYITQSELYDMYGFKIQDLNPQQDKIDINNTSNSGSIRIIKVESNGKIATKRVIVTSIRKSTF